MFKEDTVTRFLFRENYRYESDPTHHLRHPRIHAVRKLQ